MKIVYISKYTVLPAFGAPSRQYFLSAYLSKINDNEVLLIGSKSTMGNVQDFDGLFQSQKEGSLETVTLNGPKIDLGFNLKRLWSWLVFEINILRYKKKIKEFKPDLIIVSSLSILTFLTGTYLKKKLKIPLVVEVRDIYPLTLIDIGKFKKWNPIILFLKWVEKIGYKNANLLVSTLPKADEHFMSVLRRPVNFFWLPMGIDFQYYNSNARFIPSQINYKKEGDFLVLYAGTFGKANALEHIFQISQELLVSHPQIKFKFIGDGPLKQFFMDEYQDANNIIFGDFVPKSHLPFVLKDADLLINTWLDIPIYRFGISPNKWMDYMNASKPILVAYSGYKCIIEEAECGIYVPAENKSAMIKAILEFYHMPKQQREKLGENGKRYLMNHLTYERHANDLYQKLIELKNR